MHNTIVSGFAQFWVQIYPQNIMSTHTDTMYVMTSHRFLTHKLVLMILEVIHSEFMNKRNR